MLERDFQNNVWPTFTAIWPRVAKNSTMEQVLGWCRASGTHSPERVCAALRAIFDDGPRWPEPMMLRAKLLALYGGDSKRESFTSARAREEHEQFAADVRRVIDATSDEDLAAHAIMHAASHPNLLWTVHENPRKSLGMRCVLWARISAGLQPNDPTGLRKGAGGIPEMFTIPQADIDRARAEKAKPAPKNRFVIQAGAVADNRKGFR